MPHTKSGEKITWKEFFHRWGKGIEGVTPQQKVNTQIFGSLITLVGMIAGLIISLVEWRTMWWVAIILVGALIISGVQFIGLLQQKKLFNDIEDMGIQNAGFI